MGVGGRLVGTARGGSADITACQGDISFAMNHGPEEGRDRRARRLFSSTENNNFYEFLLI